MDSAWNNLALELYKLAPHPASSILKTWLEAQKYNMIRALVTNFTVHIKSNDLANEYRRQDVDILKITKVRGKGFKM